MPDLSLIIPVLNDRKATLWLLHDLTFQQGVDFEVVIVDGGSTDDLGVLLQRYTLPFPVRVFQGERGRGRQLNYGAKMAAGPLLVFLHADSRLKQPDTLATAFTELKDAWASRGGQDLAGHLSLRFSHVPSYRMCWYFYESKARSNRSLTIHGDQSFWMDAAFFESMGGFEEDLAVLEDTRLAERVAKQGGWVLLSPEIWTSPRRFQQEGLRERQTLNAIILAMDALECRPFFSAAPALYRQQTQVGRLKLTPFRDWIRDYLDGLGRLERWSHWYRAGRFVRGQAWQGIFWCERRRAFGRGKSPQGNAGPWLRWFDRWWGLLTGNPLGNTATAILLFLWFQLSRFGRVSRS